ncbi:SusC/RagA family TonB-linked outer membrane protein [Flavobacterium sp.]|jgi:TonB-linked SusC/RagA family outer membrane protein|uniref:SusC/RagA family TonB-linked outer membrane protein n=1 Tax=Flavobacterium sp. TaxID=239 RepID=UPI0037BF09E4
MKLKFNGFLAMFLLLMSQLTYAQDKSVSGTVTDQSGLPLPGVNVLVKGTQNGTQTDFDGKFKVADAQGKTLVFSFTGMKTMEASASNGMKVKMTDDSVQLEGVVVTALGIKKQQKALGYATSTVNADEITRNPTPNIINSLAGKVAGLQVTASGGAPGQASRLTIRGGNKSLTNSNEPLYVIDGVPISNANDGNANTVTGIASPNRAADINPNDVETITVLKGAAGAVLYGNRGSNGVILITTKSGKTKSGEPVIEYNSQIAFDDALVLPDYQTEFAQGNNGVAYSEGGSRSFGPRITGQTVNSAAAGAALGLGPQPIQLKVYDPRADFLKTGVTTNNNISLSSATEKYSMFISLGNSKQSSIIPNQGFEKTNGRFNANYNFTDRLSAGVNFSYNNSSGDLPFTGQDGNNPIFALYHVPVSWNLNGYGYERPDGRQINFRGGSFDNPLWSANKNSALSDSKRYIFGTNFSYKASDWLKFDYRLGNDNLIDNRTIFRDIRTGGQPLGSLEFNDVVRNEITSILTATFNKKFADKFDATLLVGQDINTRTFRNSSIRGTELVLPGIRNTNNIKVFAPGFNEISKRNLIGVFGNLTLGYNDYLYLDVVARNEWSSTLPTENRSFFYPGASLSLIFSEALGLKGNTLNYGKIRAGASKTGRDAGVYLTQQTFSLADFGDGFTPGITFPFNGLAGYSTNNEIANAKLKPEFTTEYELGIETKMLNNRLSFDFSYFRNINDGGIIPLDISPATGAQNTIINSGITKAKGIELLVNATPLKTKDFSWDVSVNYSRIRSFVEETYPGVDRIFLGGFSGNPAIFAVKGERYGSIIGSAYQRNAAGQILTDDDGYALFEDGKNLGHVEADWTGGITNTFTYKNVYFSAQIDTRQGGYIYSGTEELLDFYGVSQKTSHREEDYIFPGVNSTTGNPNNVVVKRDGVWYGSAYPNEEYVYENNWVKLREVSLGYTFNLKDKRYLKGLEVSLYGRNLMLWTDIPHIDPESSSFGTGNAQGVSRFAFPTTRTFGFNLRAQF